MWQTQKVCLYYEQLCTARYQQYVCTRNLRFPMTETAGCKFTGTRYSHEDELNVQCPGEDGIFRGGLEAIPGPVMTLRACTALGSVPLPWRVVTVTVIPLPERPTMFRRNNFRPIVTVRLFFFWKHESCCWTDELSQRLATAKTYTQHSVSWC
jgi:hypothetical protein